MNGMLTPRGKHLSGWTCNRKSLLGMAIQPLQELVALAEEGRKEERRVERSRFLSLEVEREGELEDHCRIYRKESH
jgi:hypothetical protein